MVSKVIHIFYHYVDRTSNKKSVAASPINNDDFDDFVVQAKALVNVFQIYEHIFAYI